MTREVERRREMRRRKKMKRRARTSGHRYHRTQYQRADQSGLQESTASRGSASRWRAGREWHSSGGTWTYLYDDCCEVIMREDRAGVSLRSRVRVLSFLRLN